MNTALTILVVIWAYFLWFNIGAIIAVSSRRLANYTVFTNKDYGFLKFISVVSTGPFVHFWLKKRGY